MVGGENKTPFSCLSSDSHMSTHGMHTAHSEEFYLKLMVSRFRIATTRLLPRPLSFPYLILSHYSSVFCPTRWSLRSALLPLTIHPPQTCPLALCIRSEGVYVESGLELVFFLTVLLIYYQPLPPIQSIWTS